MISRNFFAAIAVIFSLFVGGFSALPVQAQVDPGLNAVGNTVVLTDTDPRTIAAGIINVVLGLLGIIFLVLILYAGFLWMTSGGDSAKVDKAKAYLRNAIIGLVIIITSWGIATFVINSLLNATGGGGGGTGGSGGGGSGGGGFGGGTTDVFRVAASSPQGSVPNADLIVRILFNKDVSAGSLGELQISPAVNGNWIIDPSNPKRVFFTPADPCPINPQKTCFAFNTSYTVTVGSNFKSAANEDIRCGGFYPDCTFNFTAGDSVDMQAPQVDILNLYDGKSVPIDSAIEVKAHASDDAGISSMEWSEGGIVFASEGPTVSPSPKEFEASGYWDTLGLVPKQNYTITVESNDLDSNTGQDSVNVIVLAQHCFDSAQNEDETGVDCGGVDCLSCGGGTCTQNNQCASGLCLNGSCIEQPVILDVQPLSGKEGTYVSIWGDNFGDTGSVTFLGPPEVTAQAPQACLAAGATTWSPHYVLVEVPTGAASGALKLTNSNSGLADQTDDSNGPNFTFQLTNEELPGLCQINPTSGQPGINATLIGANFGAQKGLVGFGNTEISQNTTWAMDNIIFPIPIATPGTYPAWVKNDSGAESNKVPFQLQSPAQTQPAPEIVLVEPASGPRGSYLTITGQRFGSTPGIVYFYDKVEPDKGYVGDSVFPNGCEVGWWKDNQIIIKVPDVPASVTKPAAFEIAIQRADQLYSNRTDFNYTDGAAGPGICSIQPSAGPAGTTVIKLIGEGFGGSGPNSSVTFYENAIATTNSWLNNEIQATVPQNAKTGAVFVDIQGQQSNKVQFTVANCTTNASICSSGETCCPDGSCTSGVCAQQSFTATYAWQFSTGVIPQAPEVIEYCDTSGQQLQLPSPSPWIQQQGGDAVCVNPKPTMGIMFNLPIAWSTPQNPLNLKELFKLKKCTGSGADPCAATNLEDVAITDINNSHIVTPQGTAMDYVTFTPEQNLDPDTYYYVFVSTDVHSADLEYGDYMQERINCPEADLGYCYQFKTKPQSDICQVAGVYIAPDKATVQGDELQQFIAMPVQDGGICNLLNGKDFNWDWTINPNNKAWLEDPSISDFYKQEIRSGMQEAINPPVAINAKELISGKDGDAELYIRFIEPRIMAKFPDCDTACANIGLWAQFNTSLWSDNPTPPFANSVLAKDPQGRYKNVKLFKCENENCLLEKQEEVPIDVYLDKDTDIAGFEGIEYSRVRILPIISLNQATYYRVWFGGGAADSIASKYGVRMAEPYEWSFRTKLDNAVCEPDRVSVMPKRVIEDKIGDSELFTSAVYGPPDACSAGGQLLKTNKSFVWTFPQSPQNIASWVFSPPSQIDADGDLPSGCSADCKPLGSDGIFKALAQCGNGIVETTDGNYCDPNTNTTKAGQSCVLMPTASGAGEQCDKQGNSWGVCDPASCLWKSVPGGTCGNGIIEYAAGEMCDPGLRCFDLDSAYTAIEGSPCNSQAAIDQCTSGGGVCEIREFYGCTAGCRNLGASAVVGTTCGEGTIGLGEDCDLGNFNGTGGCSLNCLHTGSSPNIQSVCGNAVLEPGETCEAPTINDAVPSWCDSSKCINKGTLACQNSADPNCCGNNQKDNGEDCDDGYPSGGDGCSASCLYEGASWSYPSPSFCGNGRLENGEACEVNAATDRVIKENIPNTGTIIGAGDGKLDPKQLAQIIGVGTLDANNVSETQVQSGYEGVVGVANYGVRCGFTSESECGAGSGLDEFGCCAPRPELLPNSQYPKGSGICRNTVIKAEFKTPMNAQSVVGNFIIAKEMIAGTTACPDGSEELASNTEPPQTVWQWIVYGWHKVVTWFKGEPAQAIWCTKQVSGSLSSVGTSTTQYIYHLNTALDPNTRYIVRFAADSNLDDNTRTENKSGIKTDRGVVTSADSGNDPANPANNWRFTWSFTTGADICRINSVVVDDLNKESPGFFKKSQETHLFQAIARALYNGSAQEISQTNEYAWEWQPWIVNDPELARTDDNPIKTSPESLSLITSLNKNGSAMLFASLKIITDTLDPNNTTQGSYVEGAMPITVFICDYPWPPINPNGTYSVFKDHEDSSLLATGPYFNFQTMYCRDHENGVLPILTPHLIDKSASDDELGILRQYLFTYEDPPAFKGDGIGIRLFQNPYHYTPLEWYHVQGFIGNPEQLKIDGYEAVRDGGTVYVAFPNTQGLDQNIYQNILVISHNVNASAVTQQIFDQLLNNMVFNINFDFDNSNVCVLGGQTGIQGGEAYIDPITQQSILCVSDWDCLTHNPDLRCASLKYKLRHDMQRLVDFKEITAAAEQYKATNGKYPTMAQGTFLPSQTNSLWPSWTEKLSADLGITMPIDPVNRFVSCGFCKHSSEDVQTDLPCLTDTDCPDAYFCEARDGYDPLTCWNTVAREFKCPYIDDDLTQQFDTYSSQEPFAPSRFYKYRSFDGGQRFELAANFEVAPMSFDPITKDTVNWWTPSYPTELRQCVTDSPLSNGRFCTTIDDCKPCINPSSPTCTAVAPANSCKPVGYRWSFKNICNNDIYGETAICGDGIKGLVCSGSGNGCKANTDCPSGETCSAVEFCELGETKLVDCDYQGSNDGFKLQVCQDCKQWVDDPNLSLCRQKVECGNGRVDGTCSVSGKSCSLNTDCDSGEACQLQEVCDDGVLNGTYGHCNTTCKGIDKYCGDGKLNPGEDCDRGSDPAFGNGAWCSNLQECYQGTGKEVAYGQTCNLGCTGHAPYCGDGKVNGSESCDGNILTTAKAICRDGVNKNLPCNEDSDCDSSGTYCGTNGVPAWALHSAIKYQTCENLTLNRCATGAKICLAPNQYQMVDGLMMFESQFPTPNNYRSCSTDTGCNAGESCLPLNLLRGCNNDTECTAGGSAGVCRAYQTEHVRSCQDPNPQNANQCQFEDYWSTCKLAQYCGNGIKEVDEECDLGTGNGYDKACLPTCQLNTCGDGYLHLNVEECDNGADNGKSTCSAQYGATCNDCSQQCKILAKAGGYCGNQKKETGEQCDGNITVNLPPPNPTNHISPVDILESAINADPLVVKAQPYIGGLCEHPPCQVQCGGGDCLTLADATTVTCKQLGYDYAINDVFNRSIIIKDATKASAYRISPESSKHGLKPIRLITDNAKNNLLNRLYYNCGLMDSEIVNNSCTGIPNCTPFGVRLFWRPQNDWPETQAFWQCVNKEGLLNGFGMDGEPNDKPVCTQGCLPGGCGRCSEEPGNGEIHGYVLDRIWLQAVPGARVSLVYRGIVVDQTDTGLDGEYTFSGLNTRSECDKYKIILDKYDDNICTDIKANRPANGCLRDMTGDFNRIVDEGKNGGYWSYETDEFSVESFPWQEALGLIYIYPKPAKGEGYVAYGRPTLVDELGWSDLQNCLKTKTPGECREYLSLWLPWKKEWTPHVIWPSNQARYVPWLATPNMTGDSAGYETLCSYKDRGTATNALADNACMRDYNWFNNGNYQNLGQPPYTGVICPSMKWDWNNDANNNCPMAGADVCYDNCTNGDGGAWRLIKEWTGVAPDAIQCQQFCKISSCPTKDQILTGWNWNLSDDPLMALDRCNTTLNSAQTTAFFRYADPVKLNESLPDLNANIEIYFSGPDYEPIAGENVYTAVVPNNTEFTSWLNNQNLPPAYVNMMKTLQCGSSNGSNQPCESNVDTYINDLVAKQKFAPISWREYWARTHTKVYIATDKGLRVIENTSKTQTRSDFEKPFWHIASISPNGAVIASNQWEKVTDVVPKAITPNMHLQPETTEYYGLMQPAQRVAGLACWNMFGANCRLDFTPAHQGGANEGYQWIPESWGYALHACTAQGTVPGGQGLGVLNYFTPLAPPANNDAICKFVWNAYGALSGITIPAVYENGVDGDVNELDQYFKLYAQTNW